MARRPKTPKTKNGELERYPELQEMSRHNSSKCNQGNIDKILARLRMGATLEGAAATAGTNRETVTRWRKIDEAFDEDVREAICEGRSALEGTVLGAAAVDPYLALKILRTRHPEDWAEKTKIDVTSGGQPIGGPLIGTIVSITMTDDQIDARIKELEANNTIDVEGKEVTEPEP